MIRAVRKEVKIPIIASGGAGKVEDFPPAIRSQVPTRCWLHPCSITAFLTIDRLSKAELKKHGYTVR
mgnify:CR=1 FL=1